MSLQFEESPVGRRRTARIRLANQPTTRSATRLAGLLRVLRTESLSPKRLVSSRGLDAWYPYYAGFSSVFARGVLESLRLPRSARVLDPWNGSGTTSCAAYELGLEAVGIDLNPVAGIIAAGKLACLALGENVLERATVALAERFLRPGASARSSTDELRVWLDARSANLMSRLVADAIDVGDGLAPHSRRLKVETGFTGVTSFLLLCLLRSCRQLALKRCWSNPTWVKVREPGRVKPAEWRDSFVHTANTFIQEAKTREVATGGRVRITTADARNIAPLVGEVDVVLTSPPYCTRIDYAMTMGFELAALGFAGQQDFRALRETLMGTPVLRGGSRCSTASPLAPAVESVLRQVAAHSSYASSGYYHRNLRQYFADAQAAVEAMAKTVRRGGVCIVVVQNSYYKEIEIDLPDLYAGMARAAGFREATVPFHIPVRSFFAGINGRAARHLTERAYREAVVVMRR